MKNLKFICLVAATLVALTLNLPAQTTSTTSTKRFVAAQTNTITATVEDIDKKNREVTLKGPRGNSKTFKIGEEVKNFANMKKGDEVKITYCESIAVSLHKAGEESTPTTQREVLMTRAPGEKPGGLAVSTVDVTATVEDIDREAREVTLKGPRGNEVTLKVDPAAGDLDHINKGDKVQATYTEALGVSVEKPD